MAASHRSDAAQLFGRVVTAPATPHPRDHDAAEFALGTFMPDERAAFARDMAADAELAAAAHLWEGRLAELAEQTLPVQPSPAVWEGISARLDAEQPKVVPFASVARLSRSRSLWRAATLATGSMAAALALFIVYDRLEIGPAKPTLVAVVNRSGELPALIVRVDPRGGTVQVRSLAAETPENRSLELWSIAGTQAPKSLGVVDRAARIVLAAGEAGRLEGTTIAVTVEPKGGSPTGNPTGPVVYSGKLVPETP
jgi:anti-sigma-K factor RskA